MYITVTVIPKTKKNLVERLDENTFKVKTTAPAEKGKANDVVISVVSDYFKIKKNKIRLISGTTNRNKIFEIEY